VYGSNNNIILPQSITATNANTLVLEFGTPVSGYATAGIGGIIEVNGRTIKQYFASSLEWRFEHNFGDRFANIQTYDTNYEKIIPQTIALTDTTSSLIVFPEATEGWAIGTIGGDLPAISSSYGGYVLQVSDSAPYTASWTPAADVLVTNALTASHLNPISQSLIPAVSGAYDLGSQSNPWKHIYVGTGSIYLVDNTGTIVKTLTGDSIVTNDNLSSLNAFTASNFTTNTFTSSTLARLDSIEIVSASNNTRIGDIETFTSSTTARVNSLEDKSGSLATTGSNTFFGTQTFSGSVYIKENLIVQGSSSLQNITASAVDIGTNRIILNVDNPSVRYAGISVYDSGSTGGTGSLWWDSVENHWLYEHPSDSAAPYNSAILISGPKNAGNLGEELGLVNNYIVKSVGGDHISSSAIYDDGTTIALKSNTQITGSLGLGVSKTDDNTDYSLNIFRHGTVSNPGSASSAPALQVVDYAGDGYSSYQVVGIVDISAPRISSIDTNAGNTNLFRVANDTGTALHISGKNRVFIGQTSQTDNGQQLQVNGTSRFDGIGTFTSNLTVGGDFQLLGSNPRIDYPNNSSFRLYQTGVGTKFDVDGTNFTFYGTGVDSPKISLRGLNYVNAMIGDTTTGTTDIGNLWLYNDGTLKIRLDADNSGTSYINSNTFVVGATASSNAKFRVRHDDTDAVYTSKIQAVFGPNDYLDSDATNVFGGGTSETQFTNGNASRPAMISLGGSLNVDESLGVINFFRSGNSDNYRSRVTIFAQGQSTGTANQHGAYLEFRTANDGVAAPEAVARFEARGSFMVFRRNDNMTFADSVGALYVRQNGNHGGTEEEFRIVGRNIGFFSHTGTRHAGINSSGILGIGYGGTPAATSKIFVSRGDQYGLHIDAQTGYARLQTTDDNLYLKVGSNDMISINSTSITLSSTVTASNVTTPNFAILETGVSKTVSGYNYDATQPMAMVITQTAQTTMGLMRASEDSTGSTLRGMKARGNASTIVSVANGDDVFSVEGWAWHGSGPNYPKLGGGMKFVKDDNWGTANTRAPMRTEFYNANSGTTTQTTLVIYPSGNASLTGALTQNASDIRLKTNITKIENALEKINQLEGFTYNWNELSPMYNANTTTKEVGLSAQAVNEVLPEVVRLAPFDEDKLDGTNSKSGENYLTVQYEKLVPLLIEGIKELKQQNNSLQLQINELKNK
jgi:hypothetical protein